MSSPVAPVVEAPAVAPEVATAAPVVAAPAIPPGAVPAAPAAPAGEALPDWARDPAAAFAMVNKARAEAGKDRVDAKEKAATEAATKAREELIQSLGKSLGLIKDDVPVSADQLAAQFTTKEQGYQQQIRDLTIDLNLTNALNAADAAPFARDAIKGSGLLATLDPNAPDFAEQLQAKVGEYVSKYPQLKATPAPVVPQVGASGGDFTGATPAPPGGAQSIDEIRAERAKRRAG